MRAVQKSSCLAQLEIKFISRQKTNGAKKLTCPKLSGGANLSPAADRTSAQSEGVLAQCNCIPLSLTISM